MADTAGVPGLTFLSWYRSGLAAGAAATTAFSPFPFGPSVTVPVSISVGAPGDTAAADTASGGLNVRLHAPGDVTGLDTAAISRTYPTDGATNVDPDTFALAEFTRPDLPWLLTPAGPANPGGAGSDPRRGLLPWLTLVVVEDTVATLASGTGGLDQLTVAVTELPDLSQAWLWAHAQVLTVSGDDTPLPQIVAEHPERALSRLVSPRRLAPATAYRACLVPTFDTGAATGLGQPMANEPAQLGYAWTAQAGPVTLPVYYSWRFTTGAAGDFQSLVLRLSHQPADGVGIRPLDIGDAGSGMPGPAAGQPPWNIDLEGALVSADVTPGQWPDPAVQSQIASALAARLDGTPGELTPPVYGSAQVPVGGTLSAGGGAAWLRTLNLDPRYRTAAALGAALVRANQDALMSSAWDQAGQVQEVNQALRQGQLAQASAASSYTRRIGAGGSTPESLPDDRLLQLTSAAHASVTAPPAPATSRAASGHAPVSVADSLAANPTLTAAVSLPFRRLTRPTGPLARRATTQPLAAPVTQLGQQSLAAVPPLTPVSGMTDLGALSSNAESLAALTPQRVAQPRFSWEAGSPTAAAAVDKIAPPGYLSDLWVIGDMLARSLDWDGTPVGGWQTSGTSTWLATGPVRNAGTGFLTGGGSCVTQWNLPDVSPSPVLAAAVARVDAQETSGDMGETSWLYDISLTCELSGDQIPGVPVADSPIRPQQSAGRDVWPATTIFSVQGWSLPTVIGPGGTVHPPLPPVALSAAAGAGDLTGDGLPSVAVAWRLSVNGQTSTAVDGVPTPLQAQSTLTLLLGVSSSTGAPRQVVSAALPGPAGDVWSVAVANQRVFVMIEGELLSAPAGGGSVAGFQSASGWNEMRPPDLTWAAVTAADFTGSGRSDLLFFYAVPVAETVGAAYRGAYRVAYELGDDGEPAYWGDEIEAPVPVGTGQLSLGVGLFSPGTASLRETTSAAFRAAATATQTRFNAILGAETTPPALPAVNTAALAAAVRAAIDPATTVPAAVTAPVTVPSVLGWPSASTLAPLAFTPTFPQALYASVRDTALDRLVPGLSSVVDESVCLLGSNSNVVEAILVGANYEFGREALWRGMPVVRDGTYFQQFWPSAAPDITPIAGTGGWQAASALGSHTPAGAAPSATVLVVRGEFVRRFPHSLIYAAPTVASAGADGRTVDLTQAVAATFTGSLGGDCLLAGFPFTVAQARGSGGATGMYVVFQEHPVASRFGINDPGGSTQFGAPPARWRDLSWASTVTSAAALGAITYLDASAGSPLASVSLSDAGTSGEPVHRFGTSAADMAHITLRPPVLIAIHADDLLADPGS